MSILIMGRCPCDYIYRVEDWKLDFDWLALRHEVKRVFGRSALPDLDEILFLIGIQELGQVKENFTKEDKQDLMHIAVCTLLSDEGMYRFVGRDHDGWPHFEPSGKSVERGVKNQEKLLKQKIVKYFRPTFEDQEE